MKLALLFFTLSNKILCLLWQKKKKTKLAKPNALTRVWKKKKKKKIGKERPLEKEPAHDNAVWVFVRVRSIDGIVNLDSQSWRAVCDWPRNACFIVAVSLLRPTRVPMVYFHSRLEIAGHWSNIIIAMTGAARTRASERAQSSRGRNGRQFRACVTLRGNENGTV